MFGADVVQSTDPEALFMRQDPIDLDRIREMIGWRPRRYKLSSQWPEALHAPSTVGGDPSLVLPFCETFKNAFDSMCSISCIGLRVGYGNKCYTYLKVDFESEEMDEVRSWIAAVGEFVAIRDCLAISFALDYERENGNPDEPQTAVGSLRARAKPYERSATADTLEAANALANLCAHAADTLTCYKVADAVVAMPPSSPDKKFDLPTHIAKVFARKRDIEDLSHTVRTVKARNQLKNVAVADKLDTIVGTIEVDEEIAGRTIILIDDLYQSGTTMNYVAMELLDAGAEAVLGLCCEKTCRNDDNVSRSI